MGKSALALIGGIVTIVGVALSLFVPDLAWWKFDTYALSEVSSELVVNAFGGGGTVGNDMEYFAEEMTYMLPGILAILGGVLLLPQNKTVGIIGSVLTLVGIVMFVVLLADNDLASVFEAFDESIFWGESGNLAIFGFKWQLGYGLITTAAGALIGLLGAATAKKY